MKAIPMMRWRKTTIDLLRGDERRELEGREHRGSVGKEYRVGDRMLSYG
jgi:hypothetical protein